MPTRRGFLAGIAATSTLVKSGWALAGSPAYIAAARSAAGDYKLCGISSQGAVLFKLPLPGRGHAGARHPHRPEAVAFARRPGNFAVILDCAAGEELKRLTTPSNRHFYGHGVFSVDGSLLYTSENDLDTLDGVIGIWDAEDGYRRIGEFPSGGVGPHEITRLRDEDVFVVANGGLATHPSSGRAILNLPMMQPNLTYVDGSGSIIEQVELERQYWKNSIRHLAVGPDGLVAAAMQWPWGGS